MEEIFNPEKPDPVDIEHMSSGLTDLLKTGFSMFMKVSGHEEVILSITTAPLQGMNPGTPLAQAGAIQIMVDILT